MVACLAFGHSASHINSGQVVHMLLNIFGLFTDITYMLPITVWLVFAVLIQMQSSDGIASAAAADIEAVCEQNLLRHISRLQDGIDERLAMIEMQVTGL